MDDKHADTQPADVESIYRLLADRIPQHAGATARVIPYHAGATGPTDVREVPAFLLPNPDALANQLRVCARLYGGADADNQADGGEQHVLGTIWWYSVSSVLVAPAMESLVATGGRLALDPSLRSMWLTQRTDGRLAGARSTGLVGVAKLGHLLATALAGPIDTIAEHTGAGVPALWAIAADSIGNRLLWAGLATGEVEWATGLAKPVAERVIAAGADKMPIPRYVDVGSTRIVRRVSCCLIYRATGGEKCVSCPHQHPDERARRLRHL